jgi:ribose-phosphate pyrophosphokinase
MTASSENLFSSELSAAPIGIIAMNSVTELGNKIDSYLTEWSKLAGYETQKQKLQDQYQSIQNL